LVGVIWLRAGRKEGLVKEGVQGKPVLEGPE